MKKQRERILNSKDNSEKSHELQKKKEKLTSIEKRKLYGGDKTILYEKMGLIDETDIEKYRRKLGINKDVDLETADIDTLLEQTDIAKGKKKSSGLTRSKKNFEKEEFKKILADYNSEKEKIKLMDEEEYQEYNKERQQLKEVYRDEEIIHFPIIIKASSAGTLETLLQETEKLIKGIYRINIIDQAVGPISEADLNNAQINGATIIAFDVTCHSSVAKRVEPMGINVRMHKIIYKFIEDIENFVHDVKQDI